VNFTVTKTGTDKVAGVSCDVYHVTGTRADGKNGEADACMAQGVGFGAFAFASNSNNPFMRNQNNNPRMQSYLAMVKQISAGNRGLVKLTEYDGSKKFVRIEATKLDPTPPDDKMFEVPSTYTKMDMAGAMSKKTMASPTDNKTTSNQSSGGGVGNAVGDAAKSGAQGAVDEAARDAAAKAVKKAFHFP
jgi:hypothetical protein